MSELGWHAIYTRYQHEKAVARGLESKGYEVFLPQYAAARRWKDRTKHLSLPLFPCYVFLRCDFRRCLEIVSTPGFVSVLSYEGQPAVIPETEIDVVRRLVQEKLRIEPHPFLRCGDWVRVKWGALEGIEGILIRKKNVLRLVLSVQLLEKSVAVEVDAWAVERADRPNRNAAGKWLGAPPPAQAWV
jgi:transcription termination/antitermination protein NusG